MDAKKAEIQNGQPRRSVAHVLREVLMTLDDPEGMSIGRLTTLVRARWVGYGGAAEEVSRSTVDGARRWTAKRAGGLTRDRIEAYHRRCTPGRNKVVQPSLGVGGGKAYTAPARAATGLSDFVDSLRLANEFIARCGGIDGARRVLDALEGVGKGVAG